MNRRFAVNVLALLWLCAVTRLAFASSYAHEMRTFDYESLLTAAAAGLCGGAFKTLFTLANDHRAVFVILKESRRDLVNAFLAGGAVYVLMIMIESKWPGTVTREIRFGGVLIAGWAGGAFFAQFKRLVRAKLDGQAHEFRAGATSTDPPTSAAVPLGDK